MNDNWKGNDWLSTNHFLNKQRGRIVSFKIAKRLGETIFSSSFLLVLNYYKDNVENLQANFVS